YARGIFVCRLCGDTRCGNAQAHSFAGTARAHSGRRENRRDAADRQYGALEQTQRNEFGFQRFRQPGAAFAAPRIGRSVFGFEVAPALERAVHAARDGDEFGVVDDAAMRRSSARDLTQFEDLLAHRDLAFDDPIERAFADDILGALWHHAGDVHQFGVFLALFLLLLDAAELPLGEF